MRFFLNILQIGGKPLKKLILLNVLMFFVITLFSMSAPEHKTNTFGILGWEGPLSKFTEEFNSTFDDKGKFPEQLKNSIEGVMGDHRKYGHWGSGRNIPFEKLTKEMGYKSEFSKTEKEALTEIWQNSWDNRVKIVENYTGLTGKKSEAMMRFKYDFHLLQDYTNKRNLSLQKPMKILDDMFDAVAVLTDDSKKANSLIKKLKKLENPFNSKYFEQLMDELYNSNESVLIKKGISKVEIKATALKIFKEPEFTNKMTYHNNREFFINRGIKESDFLNKPDAYKKDLQTHKSDLAKKINLNKSTYKEFKSVLNQNGIAEDVYLKNPDKYKKIIDDYKKTYNYKMKQNLKLSAQAGLMAFGFEMLSSLVFEGQDLGDALYDSAMKGGVAGGATFVAEGVVSSLGNGKFALTALVDEQSIVKKAFGTGVNYGLITFIMDESMSVYSWAVEGRSGEELLEDTLKNAVVAGSSFLTTSVMVLCGFAPGGIVVMAVAFGTEMLVSTAIDKACEYHTFKNYLMEDDYIGFLPAEFLNTETPWNQPENETPWNQPENETPWNQPENETPWNQPENETPWNYSGAMLRKIRIHTMEVIVC